MGRSYKLISQGATVLVGVALVLLLVSIACSAEGLTEPTPIPPVVVNHQAAAIPNGKVTVPTSTPAPAEVSAAAAAPINAQTQTQPVHSNDKTSLVNKQQPLKPTQPINNNNQPINQAPNQPIVNSAASTLPLSRPPPQQSQTSQTPQPLHLYVTPPSIQQQVLNQARNTFNQPTNPIPSTPTHQQMQQQSNQQQQQQQQKTVPSPTQAAPAQDTDANPLPPPTRQPQSSQQQRQQLLPLQKARVEPAALNSPADNQIHPAQSSNSQSADEVQTIVINSQQVTPTNEIPPFGVEPEADEAATDVDIQVFGAADDDMAQALGAMMKLAAEAQLHAAAHQQQHLQQQKLQQQQQLMEQQAEELLGNVFNEANSKAVNEDDIQQQQQFVIQTEDGPMPAGVERVYAHTHPEGTLHLSRYNPLRLIPHGTHVHSAEDMLQNSGWIFFIMLITVLVSQIALMLWKRWAPRSFDYAALAGLFIIPFIMALYNGFWRFLLVWTCFTMTTAIVVSRVRQRPLAKNTPRLVYRYFEYLYRCCYAVAAIGYFLFIFDFLGLTFIFFEQPFTETALLMLFYGLYYGVTSRDLCAVVSDSMHLKMGYLQVTRSVYKKCKGKDDEDDSLIPSKSVPSNTCAICDEALYQSVRNVSIQPIIQQAPQYDTDQVPDVIKLSCGHPFHIFCIRGWSLLGKRDVCPFCHERVRLQSLLITPWQKTVIAWAFILDATRYMVVFNPIILFLAHWVSVIIY